MCEKNYQHDLIKQAEERGYARGVICGMEYVRNQYEKPCREEKPKTKLQERYIILFRPKSFNDKTQFTVVYGKVKADISARKMLNSRLGTCTIYRCYEDSYSLTSIAEVKQGIDLR